jgi:DNA-binding IscR family transcriptional regulator
MIHRLKKAGIVNTTQGRKGGVFLAKAPETLSLWDILQAAGFNSTIAECIHLPNICELTAFCKVHRFWIAQEKRLFDAFKEKMIADFAFTADSITTQPEGRNAAVRFPQKSEKRMEALTHINQQGR